MSPSKSKQLRIFDWIRAIAGDQTLGLSVKGFALELVPLVDSKTLRSNASISFVNRRATMKPRTIRRYRQQLQSLGYLKRGKGWNLDLPPTAKTTTNTENLSRDMRIPEQISRDTHVRPIIITTFFDRSIGIDSKETKDPNEHGRGPRQAMTKDSSKLPIKWRVEGLESSSEINEGGANTLRVAYQDATGQAWRDGWTRWSDIYGPKLTDSEIAALVAKLADTNYANMPYCASIARRLFRERTPTTKPRPTAKHTTKRRQIPQGKPRRATIPVGTSATLDVLSGGAGDVRQQPTQSNPTQQPNGDTK